MTSTKSLPLKQPIILLLKVEGVKSRSCSDMIGASKGGLVQMRWGFKRRSCSNEIGASKGGLVREWVKHPLFP